MADDSIVLTGPVLQQVSVDNLLVTPTGGAQGTLADKLASGGGASGPITATTLTASGNVTLSPTGSVTVNPSVASTLNNVSIGVTTPLAGRFTTLAATGNVTLSPTGSITANPSVASSMDNVAVGVTTPLAGRFTTLTSSGVVSITNASVSMTAIPTADPHVVGRLWANSGVLTISAG